MSTKRIRLVVAYDGTDFRGWAAQTGQRTVQGTLTETVRQISGEENEITGASRTDSGAHAHGQVCHFDTQNPMPPENWAGALNRLLPIDLAIRESRSTHPEFHSRFWAMDRRYRYRIATRPRQPEKSRFVHDYGRPLNLEAMKTAAKALVGEHDFLAYSEELEPGTNARRTLYAVEVAATSGEVRIEIRGTAFVRGMMRRMAGALLEVGRGKRDPREIAMLLDERQRHSLQWPVVLPAKGLTLMRVRYGRHPSDARSKNDLTRSEWNEQDLYGKTD